jgi:hypothetical protein
VSTAVDGVGGDAPTDWVEIGEDRVRAYVAHGRRGGDPGDVRDDDLVARPYAERQQGRMQPRGARWQRHAIAAAGEGCESLLELALVFRLICVPAAGYGFGDVSDFFLSNPRARDRDTRRHQFLDLKLE